MKITQTKNITRTANNVRVGIEMIEGLGVSIGIYGINYLYEQKEYDDINRIIENMYNRYHEIGYHLPREVYSIIRTELEPLFDYEQI